MKGEEVPELDERPEIELWEWPLWRAYSALSAGRRVGMGIGGIPVSDILAYCSVFHEAFDLDEMFEFLSVIRRMDAFHVDWANRESKWKSGS